MTISIQFLFLRFLVPVSSKLKKNLLRMLKNTEKKMKKMSDDTNLNDTHIYYLHRHTIDYT